MMEAPWAQRGRHRVVTNEHVTRTNLSTFPDQAAVKGDTKQSSFAFLVAMIAQNLQTKLDLEKNSVYGPKS